MKVYEVEYRAIFTLAAADMQEAVSQCGALIKDNPHLIHLRAVHERNFEPAREDMCTTDTQKQNP